MALELPDILTVKNWNTKKGVIAKMAGETGIGAALTQLKIEYDKVNWELFDPARQTVSKYWQLDKIDGLASEAQKKIGELGALRKQLIAVSKLAATIEKKWVKSLVIPASSRAHVGKMREAADEFFDALKWDAMDRMLWQPARREVIKQKEATANKIMKLIGPYIADIREAGQALLKDPKADKFDSPFGNKNKGFHSQVRGLGAILQKVKEPEWVAEWSKANWFDFTQMQYQPQKGQDGLVKAKVEEVLVKLTDLENRLR